MVVEPARLLFLILFAVLSAVAGIHRFGGLRFRLGAYAGYLWTFLLVLGVAEFASFRVAVWILALLCFAALREYFTLVDIRLQDRWAVLGAYLAIPFMIYFIHIDWYGMFIISIPVYAFLVIPFLVTLGGKEIQGTVWSIGAIDFGLFLLVYCIGHLGYLARSSTWRALLLLLAVAVCDLVIRLIRLEGRPAWRRTLLVYATAAACTVLLAWSLAGWTAVSAGHSIVLGLLVPLLVLVGHRTLAFVEADLGVRRGDLGPGKGLIIDSLKSFLYAAPVVFHYMRYFAWLER